MAKFDHSLIKQTWALLRQGLTHEQIGEEIGRRLEPSTIT